VTARARTAIQVAGLVGLFALAAVAGMAYELFTGREERRRSRGGPALFVALALALGIGAAGCKGCDLDFGPSGSPQDLMKACREMCAPSLVSSFTPRFGGGTEPSCICERQIGGAQ
jgi:hypothetical protein